MNTIRKLSTVTHRRLLALAGLALLFAGVALIYVPAALIVVGLIAIGCAVASAYTSEASL